MSGTLQEPAQGSTAAAGRLATRRALSILCVEDNEPDYRLIAEHLRDWAVPPAPQLARAKTLAEALDAIGASADSGGYDAVLLDLSLPDSFGEETFDRLHNHLPHLPVIILSGNNDRELSLKMVHKGAQDYLPKDAVNSDLLMRSILYAVRRQRQRTELIQLNERLQRATDELQTAQMQLIQAEKLESLGRIAAGVAHEVKNPLAVLQMGVDYFDKRSGSLGNGAQSILSHMQDAITRADTIIREMVDFSRSDDFQLKPCCVNLLVERSIRMVQHEVLKRHVQLHKDLWQDVPLVQGDQSKLEQVLLNILMNAMQAMPNGQPLEISTHLATVEEARRNEGSRDFNEMRPGARVVVIEVRDHGPGIAPELLPRVIEPFFTTKPTGEGTGLGLSVAKRIVDLHRGSLQLENVTNPAGLRVRIILKAIDDPPSEPTTADTPLKDRLVTTHQPVEYHAKETHSDRR